jgi:GNAT superfamily N-acetyltransferase
MKIEFKNNLNGITEEMLSGFFKNWPNAPSAATHLKILRNSYRVIVAVDSECNKVVGFINAISDGVLSAYVPLLEVIDVYQGKGIGSELVNRIIEECGDLYMVDICHDAELTPYYARFGARQSHASIFRNFHAQSGK